MSFSNVNEELKSETPLLISKEYNYDTCSQRDCVDQPDGTNVCGPWYDIDCKDSPLPSPGPISTL